jgi:hypothetical protein
MPELFAFRTALNHELALLDAAPEELGITCDSRRQSKAHDEVLVGSNLRMRKS